MKNILLVLILLLLNGSLYAEEKDSTEVLLIDSTAVIPDDTTNVSDTLTEVQKAQQSFDERQKLYKKEKAKEIFHYFNYSDSLNLNFLPRRLDLKKISDRSTIHSAGDYFRFNPSYFVLDPQETPMRSTVKPFGLAGDRLNISYNGINYKPQEHILEPDGMVDMNDIPTVLNDQIYIIPGAYGMLFDGDQTVASLITIPDIPGDYDPNTAIVVDKGGFDYSYVRGRYSKSFSTGRKIDLSTGYRNAYGVASNRDDDSYQYTGRIFLPLGGQYALTSKGQVYNRKGSYVLTPDLNYIEFNRNRIDKGFDVELSRDNSMGSSTKFIGYRYNRKRSYLDGSYTSRLNMNRNDIFTGIRGIKNNLLYKLEISGSYDKYNNGLETYDRYLSETSLILAKRTGSRRIGLTLGTGYVEDYEFLPKISLSLMSESEKYFYLLSVGYIEKAPTLNDLYLPAQSAEVYQNVLDDYSDGGNPDLESEKQLVGSAMIEFGSYKNNLRLSATGGKLIDGIEWKHVVFNQINEKQIFYLENDDITFADFQMRHALELSDKLRLLTGGAYHTADYKSDYEPAYAPDYQIFSGMELHVFWPQKQMDLFAYGEIVYAGEYSGYKGIKLGKEPIMNFKLSFQIKSFRFHYIWQNPLLRSYQVKENFTYQSRLTSYGITWHFFD